MAKVKNEVAVVEETKAVALVNSNALPSYLADFNGPTGAEDIGAEDVTIPRLKIGQDMSPEVQNGDVERYELFLNITGEVIAKAGEPLPFIVLARSKELILWRPKKDNGGGILARAKPVQTPDGVRYEWDHQNASFDVKVEGVLPVTWKTKRFVDEDGLDQWGSENPADKKSGIAATAHHNYVVLLPTRGNLIAALSLSRTAAKKAKDFNGMLKIGNGPLTSRIYTVETFEDNKDTTKFGNYKFRVSGFADELLYKRADAIASSFKGRSINVDQSDGGDHETEASGAL